jgi:tripartite-type tricarboxylate transporter receptor subunit TctC
MTVVFPVAAQNYPTKPVRIVVVSTPGGSVDTLARAIAPRLASKWNQQVLVDNRPGAGGAIAAELVAKAPPDGYTLMMGTIASLATNVSLYKTLPYDPVKDFAPITLVATQNLVLLVHPSIPSRSVKELVALAKKQPGKLTFASAGNGVGGHLSGELFKLLAQIDILHIPYKGVQPAMMDVVGGQVTMVFASIASGMAQVASKRLFPLAVTGSQRSPAAKDLPTMVEAGIKGYESSTWYGLVAPAATPTEIVNRLNVEVVAGLKSPDLHERLTREGADPVGNSPAEFAKYMQSEIDKWRKVIKAAGIQPS